MSAGGAEIPVIAVDGPSGSGKGAVSQALARRLRWHFLDSGALYRVLAYSAQVAGIPMDESERLVGLAAQMPLRFVGTHIYLAEQDITDAIRTEACGAQASQIAALPPVRSALLARQRAFRQAPGLVADGRDMGTTVFPDAIVKIFLTASAETRAERRYKQLKEKGFDVTLPRLLGEIRARDARDAERVASPLTPAIDAYILDTSQLGIAEVVEHILRRLPTAILSAANSSTD